MLDPETNEPLEQGLVSEEPGAMPGVDLDPATPVPAVRIPTPPPGPPPPSLDVPKPKIDTPRPSELRTTEPPPGLPLRPRAAMGIGHVPAPGPRPLFQGHEGHVLLGLGAMAFGFILTGASGLFGLWWMMREELGRALGNALGTLF